MLVNNRRYNFGHVTVKGDPCTTLLNYNELLALGFSPLFQSGEFSTDAACDIIGSIRCQATNMTSQYIHDNLQRFQTFF